MVVARGVGALRGTGALFGDGVGDVLGRTIVGAAGTGIELVSGVGCVPGVWRRSRPRTGAAGSVCATADVAAVPRTAPKTVMVASRAASAPRSVVIVEIPCARSRGVVLGGG